MSTQTQALILFFTTGIIFSSGVSKVDAGIDGKLKHTTDTASSSEWSANIDLDTNSMIVTSSAADGINDALKLTTGKWTLYWTKFGQKRLYDEVVFNLTPLNAPYKNGDVYSQGVEFDRKVEFLFGDPKISGKLLPIPGSAVNHFSLGSRIEFQGETQILSKFKDAFQNQYKVECSTNSTKNPKFDILLPIFGNVQTIGSVSTLTMEIPLRFTWSLGGVSCEGVAYLTQRQIQLYVPTGSKETIITSIGRVSQRSVVLEQQSLFSDKSFDTTLQNLKVLNNEYTCKAGENKPGKSVLMLSFGIK